MVCRSGGNGGDRGSKTILHVFMSCSERAIVFPLVLFLRNIFKQTVWKSPLFRPPASALLWLHNQQSLIFTFSLLNSPVPTTFSPSLSGLLPCASKYDIKTSPASGEAEGRPHAHSQEEACPEPDHPDRHGYHESTTAGLFPWPFRA